MPTGNGDVGERPVDLARLYRLLARRSHSLRDRGLALLGLSHELYQAGRSPGTAAQAAAAALPLLRESPGLQGYVYEQLASLADLRGDLGQAQAYTQRALVLAEVAEDQAGQSIAHHKLGTLAHQQGNLGQAQQHAEEALISAGASESLQGRAHLLLGWLAMQRGQMPQASQHLERALALATASGDAVEQGNAHYLLGDWALQRGDLPRASQHLERALALATASGDPLGQGNAHYLLGQVAHARGDLRTAHDQADRALAFAEQTGNLLWQGRVNYLLGQLAQREGDLSLAFDHARQALHAAERVQDVEGQARTHHLLGEVALQRGHDDDARRHLELALELAETAESPHLGGRVHLMLGEMIRRDDPGAARWHVEQSLTVATAVKDAQALGLAHYLLADLVGTSDPEEARAHSLQALTFAEATEDLVTQANVHHLLGELALEEDLEQARQQAHRALTLAEAAGSVTIAASAHMLSARVILAGPREQWPAALEPALAAVRQRERLRLRLGSAADRAQFLARTENWDRIALSLAVIRKDGNTGLELAEIGRGEALSALLHLHATEKEVPVRVRQVLADLEEAQAAASAVFDPLPAGLNGPTRRTAAELQADRGEHTRRIERLYAELTALVGNAFRQAFVPDPVDVHELRTRLPPHVHALVLSLLPDEEWSGGRGLVAVWVPPDPHRLPVVERHSLSREQAGWLSALTASDGDHAAGQRLLLDAAHPWRTELAERLLPAGLRAYLSSVDPDGDALPPTISIVPSGELWGLPFAALALADGYLIDHAVLTLVPSLRMLHPATSVKEADEDDSHTRALAYLHGVVGTEVERSQLQGNYSAEDFDEETDPKELLKKLEHGEEYRLLVLAVHGDSQPGLAHSLWLTPTFPLPAARMLNLSMPRCVVLGACWAGRLGLASGEEPIGLPTVALTRDADAITAAIYPVPSQATGAVLAIYYRNLAGGQSAAFALREAQREYVATHPPYSQGTPWHWAGLATLTTTP